MELGNAYDFLLYLETFPEEELKKMVIAHECANTSLNRLTGAYAATPDTIEVFFSERR